MLGLTKQCGYWRWAACGKHPSAKDFFSIGRRFSLAAVFSDWIEKGYPPLAGKNRSPGQARSWRFWARGESPEELACGLLRDSHDSIGRPYPLLIIGTGPLPSLEERWHELASVCEKTWSQIEYISALKLDNLKELETELLKTRSPCDEAGGYEYGNNVTGNIGELSVSSDPVLMHLSDQVAGLSSSDAGSIVLDNSRSSDSFELVFFINHMLRNKLKKAPNALFIGGSLDISSLLFFNRPLKPDDFAALWET